MGPTFGSGHSLLGRENLYYFGILVLYESTNCVLLCFVGRQLPNAENHCIRWILLITREVSSICNVVFFIFQKTSNVNSRLKICLRIYSRAGLLNSNLNYLVTMTYPKTKLKVQNFALQTNLKASAGHIWPIFCMSVLVEK